MQEQHYTKGEVLRYSRRLIHAFINRRMGDFADMLAEDLGGYASLKPGICGPAAALRSGTAGWPHPACGQKIL